MERGLAWSLLLIFFCFLTWLGWSEYTKIEAYKQWAVQFDQAKYDIVAALGQKADLLTWGKPTRQGPQNLQTLSLKTVTDIALQVDGITVDTQALPQRGKQINLVLTVPEQATPCQIGFTEIPLAARWLEHFLKDVALNTKSTQDNLADQGK